MRFNPHRIAVRWRGPGILRAHVSNFEHATTACPSFTHVAMISADMLFLRDGYAAFIQPFDGPSAMCAGPHAAAALADSPFGSAAPRAAECGSSLY